MNESMGVNDNIFAGAVMRPGLYEKIKAPFISYDMECIGPDGKVKWRETFRNLVVNQGLNDILTKYFTGSSYTAAWYLGLVGGSDTIAATDTLASHSGWTEETPYSGNRPGITWGSTSGESNTATAVSYTITGTATIDGAFICNAASGTSGILYSAGNFATARGVASGDTLNVTPTVTAAA